MEALAIVLSLWLVSSPEYKLQKEDQEKVSELALSALQIDYPPAKTTFSIYLTNGSFGAIFAQKLRQAGYKIHEVKKTKTCKPSLKRDKRAILEICPNQDIKKPAPQAIKLFYRLGLLNEDIQLFSIELTTDTQTISTIYRLNEGELTHTGPWLKKDSP